MATRSSILNRGKIVTQGLAEGGNPGITSKANTFFNLFLDQLATSYDWPWLLEEESVSISSGDQSFSVSSLSKTFGKLQALHIDSDDAHPAELQEWPEGFIDFRTRIRNADEEGSKGEPRWFFADPKGDKIWLYPISDDTYTLAVWYYHVPAALTQDSDTPWIPDASVCVATIADFAARYDGSINQQAISRNVQMARGMLVPMAEQHGRQTQVTIPFDKNVHRWRRLP